MNIPSEWTFNNTEIAKNFDKHIRSQLPWYDLVTQSITHLARHYIPNKGTVYDIGASTGNIGKAFADIIESRNVSFIGIEESQQMIEEYKAPGKIICTNALNYEYTDFDFAVLFLVLMFLPITQRKMFLNKLYDRLSYGGALIIVDKIVCPSGYIGTAIRRMPMAWKFNNGESSDDIIKKELSLAGHQRPIALDILPGNPVMFFCIGEFVGWIIEKN